jgi:hypothetical protein
LMSLQFGCNLREKITDIFNNLQSKAK